MRVVIVVQARMTSKRLPGKVMRLVDGRPLMGYLIERLSRVELADDIVIATTTNAEDDPIVEFCEEKGVRYYRGSEHDVLARYYEAAQICHADVIVRVTSDCPLIDPAVIDQALSKYIHHYPRFEFLSNTIQRTYPRGMDVEIFSWESLEQAYHKATEEEEREHVTLYIYQNLKEEKIGMLQYPKNESSYRWTVDTQEDFELIATLLHELHKTDPHFTLEAALALMERHPEWMYINSNIKQKVIT